ncbi:acyl-CoA dehydrogenase, middle domain-containing protein [Hirsutella rhossiliensis]|uniref:Acyl-CoA dehydrogenase, middle domain-containing protein n=1 Tax=Hirsutella rhossiliensis TaxID=111463 RepID=A0A9P8N7G3_9HYPO|nr:acyl-CoA dehydrogenase, middle domain-containing protein [Hirsutella rhossiliensis]KAH0968230.1 acyl-CoA dehydrogenase, middle domain-containing protein [Hirsutella rhossiliensis]
MVVLGIVTFRRQTNRSRPAKFFYALWRHHSTLRSQQAEKPDDHQLDKLRNQVRDFVCREITDNNTATIEKTYTFRRQLWNKLGRSGLLGVAADKELGGLGMGYQGHCIAMEEISRASASIGLCFAAHSQFCVNHIQLNGSQKQKEKYLPRLISGTSIGALAVSEPQAADDLVNMRTRARAVDGGYLLDGSKAWVTNGRDADTIVVYAKTGPCGISGGITAFLVETDSRGFSCLRREHSTGSSTSALFSSVFVPCENVLGRVNRGLEILVKGITLGRLVLSSGPLGIMQAVLDMALPLMHTRNPFNMPTARSEFVEGLVAGIYTKLQTSRAYTHSTAKEVDTNGPSCPQDCTGAFSHSTASLAKCTLDAVELVGEIGCSGNIHSSRLLRE